MNRFVKTCVFLALLALAVRPALAQTAPAPPPRPAHFPALPPNATHAQEVEYERGRWNYVLTDSAARARVLNPQPNALLVATVRGRPPGAALDMAMGEGRNALYLAQQGWQVTGVDVADQALAYAQRRAQQLGVKLTTVEHDADTYDWGTKKWNLIVLSYAGGREYAAKVFQALRPGGLVVLEGFHADAAKVHPIGADLVFQTDELKQLYAAAGLKVVRYEEPLGVADFGKENLHLVKLVAQRP